MIKIKENKQFQEYMRKRRVLLLSSNFSISMDNKYYDPLTMIVNEDKHISMTIILLYLVKKGQTLDALQCIKDYHLVQRFKDKQWIPHVAVLRYLKHRDELQRVQLPTVIKIYAVYLIKQMMQKRPDFTATLAISKFLKISSTKTSHIVRILGGKLR